MAQALMPTSVAFVPSNIWERAQSINTRKVVTLEHETC